MTAMLFFTIARSRRCALMAATAESSPTNEERDPAPFPAGTTSANPGE
ncbi:hypothetical protein [Microbacterium sp. cx-59]|nr:hypothetical protein [Microbacterium sp. cx-59]MCC4908988.1 hypothetical protein [Microbacterium sp. cx-59]